METILEKLYTSNLDLKKLIYQVKMYDTNFNEILHDSKNIIKENYIDCNTKFMSNRRDIFDNILSKLNNVENEEELINTLEGIIITQEQLYDSIVTESFKSGKAYQHTNGEKILIHDYVDTYYYGKGLLAETDKGDYKVVGDKEENSINFREIPMCDFIKCEKDIDVDRVFIPDDEDESFTSTEECLDYELYLLDKTYYDIENIIYESYKQLYDEEERYIETLIEDIVMEADDIIKIKASSIVKGAGKAGAAVVRGAKRMWEELIRFIRDVSRMFLTKHKKITERDAEWINDHASDILNMNTANIEINIHSDYKRNFNQSISVFKNFKSIVDSNIRSSKNYDQFRINIKKFCNSNGDLKQGLINLYRTGNANNEYTIQTIRGSAIQPAIKSLLAFCKSFIESYEMFNKELKDSESFIKSLEREVKSRKIITEGYCYIEEDFYDNTDLGLLFNFEPITEQDESNKSDDNIKVNVNNDSNKDKKVGVNEREKVKEKTDNMDNNELSRYNKMCRDKNLGITSFMTAMEKKYFESIKILRGIYKQSRHIKKNEK